MPATPITQTKTKNGSHLMMIRPLLALAGTLLAVLMMSTPARAEFGLVPDSFTANAFHADGTTLQTQAGAHPASARSTFTLNLTSNGNVDEHLKEASTALPPGFVGNPAAAPTCSRAAYERMQVGIGTCPVDSQVGIANTQLVFFGTRSGFPAPVFNLEPEPGEVAEFAFSVLVVPVHLSVRIDATGKYNVVVDAKNLSQGLQVGGSDVTLWGVPADPSHDFQRCPQPTIDFSTGAPACQSPGDPLFGAKQSGLARRPFLSNPAVCGVPQTSTLAVSSWEDPLDVKTAAFTPAETLTGCDRLQFRPTFAARPSTSAPDSATGLDVDIDLPYNDDPDGLATPPLKDARVTLPEGMTINPSAADGLGACTDAQLGLKSDSPVGCPDSAKLGTVTATSPVLEDPVEGAVYLRSQNSGDPGSGEMYRMALVLSQPARGLLIKLPGQIRVDKDSGRIVTEFIDNPQLPVSKLSLKLKTGPRAPLAMPTSCGTKTISARLTSWGGQVAELADSFTLDENCDQAGRFEPSLSSGFVDPRAGNSSPFTLTLARPSGQQDISGLDVTLPPGVLGNIGAVPQCPEDRAAAGTCDPASRVGTTTVAVGAGPSPLSVPQVGKSPTAVYLAGPYKGAPFSLSIVVPAQAGPFDLGTVVVRAALFVDPIDAHVTVVSDPIPTIVAGVALRIQRITVAMDRSGFMVSPTNCDPMQVGAQARSAQGASVALSNRFQMGECSALALNPKLDLSLSGKGQTTDGKHPAVTANVTQKPGQANLKRVRVALPLSLALDPDNANGLCEFVDGSKVTPTCPKASIVGSVTATTPILSEPLSGPVYFVKNIRKDAKTGREIRTLPKLVIPLTGQNGVKLTLTGTSDVVDDQLVTTFDSIPDAPVSSFKLSIIGGKGGILTVSGTDICKATQIAEQQVDGQNAKHADADVYIQTPACPTKVISKKITAKTVVLKLGGLGAGKVTVSGRGLRTTRKAIAKSTVASVTVRRAKGRLGKAKVSFVPAGAKKAKTTSVTLK